MRGVRKFQGGEAVEAGKARKPCRRFRIARPNATDRRAMRDAAVAILAGLVALAYRCPHCARPFDAPISRPLGRDDLATVFNLSRSQMAAILARFRDGLGGRDAD